MDRAERFRGALLGLAYGDAISFPALFHRFSTMPRRRHQFLWRTNAEQDEANISTLTLPFTHRNLAEDLHPCPTDDTEYALFTARILLDSHDPITPETFSRAWREQMLPHAAEIRSSVSVRAALDNLARGLEPPTTGNDNPLHYEDSAVIRAVPIGLYCAGDADRAAAMAGWDAQITQAEDGIWAARAMAAAIALLANGAPIPEAVSRARAEFPAGSWIAAVDAQAQACRERADNAHDLALLIGTQIINTVYSYGGAAPETLPAALVLTEACHGDLLTAVHLANTLPKSSDTLPAMVGALCGAFSGDGAIGALLREALTHVRGLCLPHMKGVSVLETADALAAHVDVRVRPNIG